jgi:hypothetical protein
MQKNQFPISDPLDEAMTDPQSGQVKRQVMDSTYAILGAQDLRRQQQ